MEVITNIYTMIGAIVVGVTIGTGLGKTIVRIKNTISLAKFKRKHPNCSIAKKD